MTDKSQSIKLAEQLVTVTNMSVDLILQECGLTHEEYRKYYPETKITPTLALDILDARDIDELTNLQIQKKWNLSTSQLHYALYNNNAIVPKPDYIGSPRALVIDSLRTSGESKSQTSIAEECGVSQSFVHKIAKELDLLPNNRKKRVTLTEQQWEEILIKAKTIPVERLAKQYGVSRDTLYKRLRNE
tara:strand:+ start:533 stop:1096 length:564 start_codon:yes stop_codon:yes gene_type:complete